MSCREEQNWYDQNFPNRLFPKSLDRFFNRRFRQFQEAAHYNRRGYFGLHLGNQVVQLDRTRWIASPMTNDQNRPAFRRELAPCLGLDLARKLG
jgi:hypothetical protein